MDMNNKNSIENTSDQKYTYVKCLVLGQSKIVEDLSQRRVSDNSEEKKIDIAIPFDTHPSNTLTIIAGKNRTGKSHLLRNAESAINTHNDSLKSKDYQRELGASSSSVWARPLNPDLPFGETFYVRDISDLIARFAIFGGGASRDQRQRYDRLVSDVKSRFIKDQFTHAYSLTTALGDKSPDEIDEAWRTEETRLELIKLLDQKLIYRVSASHCPAIAVFENIVGAKLYLRPNFRMKGMELVLRYSSKDAFTFGSRGSGWSQGQKVVCILLLLIAYIRPCILLIDELENHLHPEYISKVCEFIKENVPQSIIVTHHPHLLFSSHVDKAWFLEVTPIEDEAPAVDSFPELRSIDRPPPKRKIVELNGDFERIAAVYDLFDSHDLQLMNLATASQAQMSREILHAIETGLTLHVANSSRSKRADTQSRELADAIKKVFASKGMKRLQVLDYGAGKGRTFFEIEKTSLFDDFEVDWCFYEPFPSTAEELNSKISDVSNVRVTEDISKERDGTYDIILAVNLLHECNPDQISEVLRSSARLLSPNGRLLIAELHPLLSPERFGIGYAPGEMIDIIRCCGFVGRTIPVVMRSGLFTAYTCICSVKDLSISLEDGAKKIRDKVWNDVHSRTLSEYVGGMEMGSSRNAIKLASELHVIASIAAYDAGLW